MNILFRYIARSVLVATLLVFLVMLALVFLIGFLDELRDVGTGDYGFYQALIHVILETPRSLYQFFPMLMLMGAVLGLGVLSANQELVVMRTAGYSVRKISIAVIVTAIFLVLITTVTGEWLAPKAHHLASIRKQSEENGGQAVSTLSGVWVHEGNNFLHISHVIGLKELEDVTRYEFDEQHHLLASYHVKSLQLKNHQWILQDEVKTTFANNKITSQLLSSGTWDLKLNPNLLNVGLIEPSEMSLHTLRVYTEHLSQNGLQSSEFQWEFWKRVFQPITTLIIILLAIPFVFGSSRSVPMGWRVVFAIIIGFTFYILNAFLGEFSVVFQISPFLAACMPVVIFSAVAYGFSLKLRH